jgi:hypothetical protein
MEDVDSFSTVRWLLIEMFSHDTWYQIPERQTITALLLSLHRLGQGSGIRTDKGPNIAVSQGPA